MGLSREWCFFILLQIKYHMKTILNSIALVAFLVSSTMSGAQNKELVDFFLPIPIQSSLVSEGVWGDKVVLPRDTTTGLEDRHLKNWCYWDGNIIKGDDGKYHMMASRWSQSFHHGDGWTKDSRGIHAVSDNLVGPYRDGGLMWPQWNGGQGHNVIGLRTKDGKYAAISSECVPGNIYISDTPEGPYEHLGQIQTDSNGYYEGWIRYNELDWGANRNNGKGVGKMANVMLIERHDGRYMILARHCMPLVSEGSILGPYKAMGERAWWGVEGIPQFRMEDPTIWYSNGLYHIVVNHYSKDHTYHLTSEDGFDNWRYRGIAFHHDKDVFKYTDGTVNHWYTVQRPTVYVEDGEIKAFNFSVIDVHKGADAANDNNGSKIMVVPFDGKAFGKHISKVVADEYAEFAATPPPAPWTLRQTNEKCKGSTCGYDTEKSTIRMYAKGKHLEGNADNVSFLHQTMEGDISLTTKVLSHYDMNDQMSAGLMLRSTLASDEVMFSALMSNDKGLEVRMRSTPGDVTERIKHLPQLKAPYWLRIEKRGDMLKLYVSTSNNMNWDLLVEQEVQFGSAFLAGVAAENNDKKKPALARFKDTDLHPYGQPINEGIVSHTFPDTIPPIGEVQFQVEIEEVQPLDIYVTLQNIKTQEYTKPLLLTSQTRYKKKNILDLTYTIDESLDPNATYWFCIKQMPMHFHDSEATASSFKRIYVKP